MTDPVLCLPCPTSYTSLVVLVTGSLGMYVRVTVLGVFTPCGRQTFDCPGTSVFLSRVSEDGVRKGEGGRDRGRGE